MSNANYNSSRSGNRRKNIFISYRVKDTAGETGRLADTLRQYFYEDQIFMDIDKLEPGVDFTDVISKSLEQCDVMLAVIGPEWTGASTDGRSRIKDPNDWVGLEIATALQRGIRVVPVLVDGATLPSSEELPDALQPLLRRQAYEISNKRWRYDTENLAAFLEKSLGIPRRNQHQAQLVAQTSPFSAIVKWGLIGLGGLFVLLLVYYGINGNVDDKVDPKPPVDTSYSRGNNNDVDDDEKKVNPAPNNDERNNPPPADELASVDVEGIWDDANGLYYLVITNTENQPEIVSYALSGQQTGEGFGTLNGRNLTFKLSIVNFGIINGSGKISSDGNTIQGTTTVTSQGQDVREPLVLRRRA